MLSLAGGLGHLSFFDWQRPEHPARHRCVPQLMVEVGAERGVKLGERPAAQRGAQPLRVPGSDPQLVGSPLTGELRVQGRRERRLVGDDEAGRVGGERREAAEDPDHARGHREAVHRQGDAPAGFRRGRGLRIGEHRDRVRVGWLSRPEHAGRSARGEGHGNHQPAVANELSKIGRITTVSSDVT